MPLTPRPPDSFDPPSSAEPTRYPDPPYPESAPPPYPKPGAGPPPAGPLAIPPQPPAPAPRHAHRLCTDQRRVHLRARQRHADATALGALLIHLPFFLCSVAVVALLSPPALGDLAFLGVLGWLATGLLVFHRPTESLAARRVLGLRRPTPQESSRLTPVWREVTARAGVDATTYTLWIEENDTDLNAVAAAGHIVGVTTFSLGRLPDGELAAVLAHELGHHVGGHAWASLLGHWYALPARLAYRAVRFLTALILRVAASISALGHLLVVLLLGIFAFATITTLYGLPLLILAAPYALAAVGRRAELRADQHAAALGFAPMLASVLHQMHEADQAARHQAALAARAAGTRLPEESAMAKLLATHPDHHTRLHHLQPWLQPRPPR
ncbi:peptidase M48 [Streptomyces rutgersensis]|uniref:M48 family metalloprotease n=1 Tax=Streptomyces rutgersensis TaxID=53451 RepID=UPI0013CC73DA|nr:M48 family metalloprotease [Streptomyces rutgersensis]GFH65300.1 peptidase M48 [Streptomyces rutgersensis]